MKRSNSFARLLSRAQIEAESKTGNAVTEARGCDYDACAIGQTVSILCVLQVESGLNTTCPMQDMTRCPMYNSAWQRREKKVWLAIGLSGLLSTILATSSLFYTS